MCKGIHNFGNLSSLQEILCLLLLTAALERVYLSLFHVFGDLVRIFAYPQHYYVV
jgi:hypothetical protein